MERCGHDFFISWPVSLQTRLLLLTIPVSALGAAISSWLNFQIFD
jgi:hypothetical protein